MWEDMVTYWAWRGEGIPTAEPTCKRVEFADCKIHTDFSVHLNYSIACVVCDDDVCKRINEGEIMDRIQQGWEVTFPEKFHALG